MIRIDQVGRISASMLSSTPPADRETVLMAIRDFSFLLGRGMQCSFQDFSGRIAQHYCLSNPRTAHVCQALNRAHSHVLPLTTASREAS